MNFGGWMAGTGPLGSHEGAKGHFLGVLTCSASCAVEQELVCQSPAR